MNKHIELRLKHSSLIIQGKPKEAFEVLKEIWALDKGKLISVKKESPKKEVSIVVKVKPKKKEKEVMYKTFNSLSKIKGIGKETVSDLKGIYSSIENLIESIKSGKKIPLRNDIVIKLKEAFK